MKTLIFHNIRHGLIIHDEKNIILKPNIGEQWREFVLLRFHNVVAKPILL